MRNMKKMMATGLAVGLVATISIAGTLAYLTAGEDDSAKVTNTFISAGGLIDPEPDTPDPRVPDNFDDGFFLAESPVEYADGAYSLKTGEKYTAANTYDKIVPGMTLPKDPIVKVDIVDGVRAYVFVKMDNTMNDALSGTVDTTNWTAVPGQSNLYYYSGAGAVNGVVTGNTGYDVAAKILVDDKITVSSDASSLSEQLGTLEFTAYACQAEGFDTPAAAYTACFTNSGN